MGSFYDDDISLWVLIIFKISVSVRRIYDVGKRGYYTLLFLFMPFTFILLYFLLLDSKKEINQWGASPKYPSTNFTEPYTPYEEPQEYQQPMANNPNVIYIKETKVIYLQPNSLDPYPYLPPQSSNN